MTLRLKAKNTDEYIDSFPKEVQNILNQVRSTIKKAAPKAQEKISYGIPAFTLDGKYLIYFAGFKKHIGMYPVPRTGFEKDFTPYKTSGKGTIQFNYDEPLPLPLITKIIKFIMKKKAELVKAKKK